MPFIDNHFGGFAPANGYIVEFADTATACAVFAPDFLDQISANLNMNNARDLFICELFFFKLHVHVRFYLIQI